MKICYNRSSCCRIRLSSCRLKKGCQAGFPTLHIWLNQIAVSETTINLKLTHCQWIHGVLLLRYALLINSYYGGYITDLSLSLRLYWGYWRRQLKGIRPCRMETCLKFSRQFIRMNLSKVHSHANPRSYRWKNTKTRRQVLPKSKAMTSPSFFTCYRSIWSGNVFDSEKGRRAKFRTKSRLSKYTKMASFNNFSL